MKYADKTHPKREVSLADVELIGHRCVRATLHYNTTTNKLHTWHKQTIEFSLCDAQQLGRALQDAADDLEAQLVEFRSDISGG